MCMFIPLFYRIKKKLVKSLFLCMLYLSYYKHLNIAISEKSLHCRLIVAMTGSLTNDLDKLLGAQSILMYHSVVKVFKNCGLEFFKTKLQNSICLYVGLSYSSKITITTVCCKPLTIHDTDTIAIVNKLCSQCTLVFSCTIILATGLSLIQWAY